MLLDDTHYVFISKTKYRLICIPMGLFFILSVLVAFLSGIFLEHESNNIIYAVWIISLIHMTMSLAILGWLLGDNPSRMCGKRYKPFKYDMNDDDYC
jgi:hypothetical protein